MVKKARVKGTDSLYWELVYAENLNVDDAMTN